MKKVLIVYASKTGTTQDVANALAKKLPAASVYDCRNKSLDGAALKAGPHISDYGIVVLGTAMYIGAPVKEFKKFISQYKDELAQKPIAFFTCGVGTQQEDEQYLLKSLPEELKAKDLLIRHMGGEVRPEKMSGFAKLAMKEYEKQHGQAPGINWRAVDGFAEEIQTWMGGKAE